MRRQAARQHAGDSPVLLKIAPDLSLNELDDVRQRISNMEALQTESARQIAEFITSLNSELTEAKQQRLREGKLITALEEYLKDWKR